MDIAYTCTMILIENMICPPVPVFAALAHNNTIVLERHEHYQKRSFRNRIYLKSAQGISLFTIPLIKGKNNKSPIVETLISYEEDWIHQFSKVLLTNYGSAPFYHDYVDGLFSVINQNISSLYYLNLELLHWIVDVIGLNVNISQTESYQKLVPDDIDDRRGQYVPKPGFFSSKDHITYPQVHVEHSGFCGGLSILDLLFSCGPESISYLK